MKKIIFILLLTSLLSADIAVVISKNSSINEINRTKLRDIFLRKRFFIDETKVVPLNLATSFSLRGVFERQILRMESEELSRYWNERHFNGVNPPLVLQSYEAVRSFVKKVEGSIGYIDTNSIDSDLRVLMIIKEGK